MKIFGLASLIMASAALISQPLLAQDDSALVFSEEVAQELGETEKLAQLFKQERKARRIAAVKYFESLSEKEQAGLRERRQQRRLARRLKCQFAPRQRSGR
jgi:hypothetical protein